MPSHKFHVRFVAMNEFELIELLTADVPRMAKDLVVGVGDDCAVIDGSNRNWLVSTDALVEGVHFSLAFSNAHDLGKRMLGVNVSDIAAMGGQPRFFTIALGVPSGMGEDRLRDLYDGIKTAAKEYGALLIGGDTVAADQLTASITIIGEADKKKTILRNGARPGDAIYVTGNLGMAALGLGCLKRGIITDRSRPFIEWYRKPRARIEEGQSLASTGFLTSMIDISDGLMADLDHLAGASQTGYEIQVDMLPQAADMASVAHLIKADPIQLMLGGGDDYELAFTVAKKHRKNFAKWHDNGKLGTDVALTRIGKVVEDPDHRIALTADGSEVIVSKRGFDHFMESARA